MTRLIQTHRAAFLAFMLFLLGGSTVHAQTQWNKGTTGGTIGTGVWSWNDAANWSAGIPVVGSNANFMRINWSQPIGIDVNGANLNLGATGQLTGNYNGSVEVFYDSANLAPASFPLGTATNFNILNGGTLTGAANLSNTLTVNNINFNKQHQVYFYMPVNVNNLVDNGSNYTFYGNVTANNIIDLNGRSDTSDQVRFYGTVTAPQIDISTKTSATAYGTANFTTMNIDDAQAMFTAETGSNVSIGTLNLSNGVFSAKDNLSITTFNWTGGAYEVAADGAASPSNVPQGGELRFSTAQSSFPTVSVAAFGVLSGNLTGADYSGGGQNVTLVEDAILSAAAGPVPTRGEVGGAILGYGIPDANSGGPYLAGDDGSTTIYKFLALGPWAPNKNVNTELGAVAGSGDLNVVVLSEQDVQGNNAWRGDGSSTTANISFPTFASGRLDLVQGLNENATGPNLIDTFNLSSDHERANILRMESSGVISAGQTINVDGGRVSNTNQLTGGNLKGTLSISNGQFDQPSDDFTSADTGTLHIGNRGVLAINNTGNFDAFEALGSRLTYSGNPVAMWQGDNSTPQDPDLANNTVLAGFLANSDWVPNSYKKLVLASDVELGHGHYIFNTYDRGNGSGWEASGGAKILYAQNGPMDGTDWIGIAATGSNQPMRIDIFAPDATLVVGSTDPTRLFSADNDANGDIDFYDVSADKTVQFFNPITAAGLDVQSGTARFSTVDQAFPNLHIEAGATVQLDNNRTITVAGAFGGNGTYSGGNGIVVQGTGSLNPGDSIGMITGTTLLLEGGATYNWEVGAATGTPGTDWDLSLSTALDVAGTLNFNIIEFGLSEDILESDAFVVAAADSITNFDPNDVMFNVIADQYSWNLTNASLTQQAGTGTFNGQDVLVLTGITAQIAGVPEPASLAIWMLIGLSVGGYGFCRARRKTN